MNKQCKFSKFPPSIPSFDAESHYPLVYSIVNDKIKDTRGDSYFRFLSARSRAVRDGRKEKKKDGISESQVPETH